MSLAGQHDDVVPWKRRFRAPRIYRTSIARAAPDRGLATSNRTGVVQLYAWDVRTGALRQLTDRPEGLASGTLSPDGRHVYYLDDRHGDEIGHIVYVPYEGGVPRDLTPDLPPYAFLPGGLSCSRSGNRIALVVADAAGFHTYCLDVDPDGAPARAHALWASAHLIDGPRLSHGGEVAAVSSTERSGTLRFSVLAFDVAGGEQIGELWDGPGSSVEVGGGFSPLPGDARLLATTNRDGAVRPLIWDPRGGERIDLALDGIEGDVYPWDWSPDGGHLLLCQFDRAVQRLYTYDVREGTATALHHPRGSVAAAYYGPDGDIFAQWEGSTHPSQLIALDARTGARTRTVLAAGDAPPGYPWRPVTFASSDGQEIQGWLGLPDGAGPFPTILETHGGPTAVTTEVFSPQSQAWLDHGYAFLTINYRGSTTFGRDFQDKIIGDLGHWEVEDMVAARRWLVDEGIARPDRVFLTGWSYGGYLTLQALGAHPELWAGGMAGIAIADWSVQYEDTAATLRGYQEALLGGTPWDNPDGYRRSSPITYAERVQAPVLIIQGRNDTRTPARPVEMYEARMKALGKRIEVHWFDAGHASAAADVERAIAHQQLMLDFAERILARTIYGSGGAGA